MTTDYLTQNRFVSSLLVLAITIGVAVVELLHSTPGTMAYDDCWHVYAAFGSIEEFHAIADDGGKLTLIRDIQRALLGVHRTSCFLRTYVAQ